MDTAGLIALGNKQDTFHEKSWEIQRKLVLGNASFMCSDFVIVEFCNAFSKVKLRETAVKMVKSIYESERWEIVPVSDSLMRKSFNLFEQMQDKEWGLVDCSSIILSRERKLSMIFTTDKHFEQAGFEILLK
jgi:predicted nucleic acid-binding protein